MNKFLSYLIITFMMINYPIFTQSNSNKNAGVAFRLDDNQNNPYRYLDQLVNIFNARKLKFTYAVNFGFYATTELLNYLVSMQQNGFELADHTPDHETSFFYVAPNEVLNYTNSIYSDGIDHIWNINSTLSEICLKVGTIKTDTYTNEGLINVSGNTVTLASGNNFFEIQLPSSSSNSSNADRYSMNAIYIPAYNQIFKFQPENVSTTKITGLTSFWGEPVNLEAQNNIPFEKLNLYDVNLTDDAWRVMALRTQNVCDTYSIDRIKHWVQPGGRCPRVYREEIARALKPLGYTVAGVFADPSRKCFNEFYSYDFGEYGMNWEDFSEDYMSLSKIKNIIANRYAKHYVSISRTHLRPNYVDGTDYTKYFNRVDSLLTWLQSNQIPIKTVGEWAKILYDTLQNPFVNIMPKLESDLDNDGKPDGFDAFSDIVGDGVPESSNKSFCVNGNKTLFRIYDLGGAEKGLNNFSIWIKGIGTVRLEFRSDWGSSSQYFIFYSNDGDNFNKFSCQFYLPTDIPTIKKLEAITINTGESDTIKISGIELRGTITPPMLNQTAFDIDTKSITLVWEDNSNNEAGFRVKRMFEHENIWKTINNNLPNNTTNYIDELLDFPDSLRNYDSITVYYKVDAFAAGGEIEIPSNIINVKIDSNEPLPVELSSFSAKYNNKIVLLDWKTETEVNNYGFDVERRTSPNSPPLEGGEGEVRGGWERIGFVQGHGNSNSPKRYSFLDKNLFGSNKFYYRLKQIDNDGQFSYSNEIEVEIVPAAYSLEQNFPNPFNPITKIRYQLPEKNKVSLKVFNSLGEELVTLLDDVKEPGNYEVDFDASNLSSGVYFFRMQTESFISTKKMVIIK